ncbi:glycosyltransferase family 2 protein [Leisingera sp. NJS201]|uniref:glycosyltransferase family 2 protein n=1 Tax=Leisingera sp. NJS201 TaxID=2508306 RepID=UPI0020C7F887|nr:glycosyltransferase family 2 protein [Leisingera sp. NJS201]
MTRVDVTLCTFRRASVHNTLVSLAAQRLPEGVSMRIVVADNDETDSSRTRIAEAAKALQLPLLYVHAPARNISIARNACLEAADADWVAFLDDDERAEPDWLARLLDCACSTPADAVFGPALAEYGPRAPGWMRRQDHHSNRPVLRGGQVETGHTCNALLRWRGASWQAQRFDPGRGKSGERIPSSFSGCAGPVPASKSATTLSYAKP